MKLNKKIFLWMIVILVTLNQEAKALWVHLNETQKGEAMSYGMRNVNTGLPLFFKEWTVDLGKNGTAILNSEFLTLAFAARDAALSGQEMDSYAIDDALAKAQGKLVFTVTVFGKGEDFAKDYEAVVQSGGKTLPATYWEEGEVTPSESQPGMVVQDLFYYFPIGEIPLEGTISLLVENPQKKERIQFTFDLKKIK
ncbi:MAG: hypothetical protein ACYDBV_07820 [Nitrospiria bacterium]